jgi:membrane fusion protein (multidrug efflux system)
MSHCRAACAAPLLLLAALAGLLGLAGCDETGAPGSQDPREQAREDMRERAGAGGREGRRAVPVTVSAVRRGDVEDWYTATTTLSAEEEAIVVARTAGVVKEIYAEEGDEVVAGQPLALVDTERLQLELKRAEVALGNLERAYERARRLKDTGHISEGDFDRARFEYENARAGADLQRYQLREATIRSPIAGVVAVRHIKVGHNLTANAAAFEVKRAARLEAILNVPERELARLAVGQQARVSVDARPQQPTPGVVSRISPAVDAGSGTFRVTVALDNADGALKAGMFARVGVLVDRREGTLLVPREAVVRRNQQASVFVVRDGTAVQQVVETGYATDSAIEILAGVRVGEPVVTLGQGSLRDGAAVRVVDAGAAAAGAAADPPAAPPAAPPAGALPGATRDGG